MKTLMLAPQSALKPYIQHYVYCEIGVHEKWSSMDMAPTGCTSLSIAIGKENIFISENDRRPLKYESVSFVGQTTGYKKLSLYDRLKSFFVLFKPCGAYQLLNISQDDCKNICLNLSDMLGTSTRIFKEELADKSKPEDIKSEVEKFFLKRMRLQKKHDEYMRIARVIKQIQLNSNCNTLIEEISRREGYSMSKLERKMKEIVGLSPKMLQRIMRFNNALQFINMNGTSCNWSKIACNFGYFDQTHFIKEFKLFYGRTPSGYSEGDRFLSSIAFDKKTEG